MNIILYRWKKDSEKLSTLFKDIPGQTQFLVQVNLTMTMNCIGLDQVWKEREFRCDALEMKQQNYVCFK